MAQTYYVEGYQAAHKNIMLTLFSSIFWSSCWHTEEISHRWAALGVQMLQYIGKSNSIIFLFQEDVQSCTLG